MGIFNRHRHLRPEILSEYLDGRLDQRHQELVARRLAGCPACREELNTLQATVSALQSLPDLPLPRSFTLPTAPSPDYPAELIRQPTPLVMKLPGWAYGSAASLAGLALALMLSAEAAGLASPASFQETAATADPGDVPVAQEAQVEAQVAVPEMADQAAAPAESPPESQAATPSLHALRAKPAPTPEAATEIGETLRAAKSLAEPAGPAPEMAMTESQGVVASDSGPVAERAAAAKAGPAGEEAAADIATDVAGEEAAAFSGASSDDGAPVPEESPPAPSAEKVPVAPADSAQNLTAEAEPPKENLSFPAEKYSAPSSPAWWKALETMFAALTLAFLGGLFFRWRRNRTQSNS